MQERYKELDRIITSRRAGWYDIGSSLREMRDTRLYTMVAATFREYVARHDMQKSHAYQLIVAADFADQLSLDAPDLPLPAHESQVRPIVAVPQIERVQVWAAAVRSAPGGNLTAAHVRKTVNTHLKKDMTEPLILDRVKKLWNKMNSRNRHEFAKWAEFEVLNGGE